MKLNPLKRIPALIASGVIVLVCLAAWARFSFIERLELMTYDMRLRHALNSPSSAATNLGFVFINEESVQFVRTNRAIGFHFGLYWPRQVYGRLISELAKQEAKAVALDVLFPDLRDDHPPVTMAAGPDKESDDFFAMQMARASNVILAVNKEIPPPKLPSLFATNAAVLGHILADPDADGILRHAQAFRSYTNWHPAFLQVEANPEMGVDLDKARVEPTQIILKRSKDLGDVPVPLDKDGNFDVADFWGEKLPPGVARKAKPFTMGRVWHLGVTLAAQGMGLDLSKADVDLPNGRIVLRGPGVERVIPVDRRGYFYIDWCLPPNDPRLTQESIEGLLAQSVMRLRGQTEGLTNRWRGKLAVVGSSALVGHDLTDVGPTPMGERTLLVSEYWNVANSLLTGQFVRRAPLAVECALIAGLGLLSALVTWRLRMLLASSVVVIMAAVYIVLGGVIYKQTRFWVPLALPIIGSVGMQYVCLIAWRVVFEQAEQRRVKSIFSKVVSPKIVKELLDAPNLALGGARREISVLFADVRGFTAFTDLSQDQVTEYINANKLTGAAAEACHDEQARETLSTVNQYLGLIAEVIKHHDGTLDKFIGDCVMAFWGAPATDSGSNPRHALNCVRAAIEAQLAMYALNQQRATENNKRQLENLARLSAGLPPKPMLPILLLGTGINTGMATAGLMGSAKEENFNYTVFGREVNLASRLESASGRGRIFIGATTYEHLQRDDPALAATCVELSLKDLKGFRTAVKAYEVPWRPPGSPPFDEEFSTSAPADATSFTGFVQRNG